MCQIRKCPSFTVLLYKGVQILLKIRKTWNNAFSLSLITSITIVYPTFLQPWTNWVYLSREAFQDLCLIWAVCLEKNPIWVWASGTSGSTRGWLNGREALRQIKSSSTDHSFMEQTVKVRLVYPPNSLISTSSIHCNPFWPLCEHLQEHFYTQISSYHQILVKWSHSLLCQSEDNPHNPLLH